MDKKEKIVYDGYLKVVQSEVDLGDRTKMMEKVDHPDSVSVLIINSKNDSVIFVKQYRYPVNQETIEVVAGKIEEGESPESAAIREVLEETGYVVEEGFIEPLRSFWKSPGYTSEVCHLFIAGVNGKPQEKPTEEGVEVVEIDVEDFISQNTVGITECITTSYFRNILRAMLLYSVSALDEILSDIAKESNEAVVLPFYGQSGEA